VAAASILGFLLLFSAPLGAQVETQPESRPKPVITPIQVPNLSLGVVIFPNGKAINLSVGTGSSAYRNPNDLPGRIWLLTDRGPNIECGEARRILGLEGDQACAGNRMGRIFPLPGFRSPASGQWPLRERLCHRWQGAAAGPLRRGSRGPRACLGWHVLDRRRAWPVAASGCV